MWKIIIIALALLAVASVLERIREKYEKLTPELARSWEAIKAIAD
jgi:hypothetical protein